MFGMASAEQTQSRTPNPAFEPALRPRLIGGGVGRHKATCRTRRLLSRILHGADVSDGREAVRFPTRTFAFVPRLVLRSR